MESVFVGFRCRSGVSVVEGSLIERLPAGEARVRLPASSGGGAAGAAPAAGSAASTEHTVNAHSWFPARPSDLTLLQALPFLLEQPEGVVPAFEVDL